MNVPSIIIQILLLFFFQTLFSLQVHDLDRYVVVGGHAVAGTPPAQTAPSSLLNSLVCVIVSLAVNV